MVISLQPSFDDRLDVVGVLGVDCDSISPVWMPSCSSASSQAVVRGLVERLVVEAARVGHHAGLEVGVALGGRRGARMRCRSGSAARSRSSLRVAAGGQGKGSHADHQRHTCRLLHGVLLNRLLVHPDREARRRHPSRGAPRNAAPLGREVARLLPGLGWTEGPERRPSASTLARRCPSPARRRAGCPGGGRTSVRPACASRAGPSPRAPGRGTSRSPRRRGSAGSGPRRPARAPARRRGRGSDDRLDVVDHRRDAPLVVDLGAWTPYGATICSTSSADQLLGLGPGDGVEHPHRAAEPAWSPG